MAVRVRLHEALGGGRGTVIGKPSLYNTYVSLRMDDGRAVAAAWGDFKVLRPNRGGGR